MEGVLEVQRAWEALSLQLKDFQLELVFPSDKYVIHSCWPQTERGDYSLHGKQRLGFKLKKGKREEKQTRQDDRRWNESKTVEKDIEEVSWNEMGWDKTGGKTEINKIMQVKRTEKTRWVEVEKMVRENLMRQNEGETVKKTKERRSNQIKSLLLSHHHSTCALMSEILESVAPDSAETINI